MTEHLFQTRVEEIEKVRYDNPLVIGGFVGPGLVGLVSASYIIEQLGLHQVAHVKSQHIPPVAVFIGEKLRHPFRIYRNHDGKLVVIICEVPIDFEGLYEISSVLLDWLEQIHAKEIVILDGVPVSGIQQHREAYCVAEEKRRDELKSHGVGSAQSALISGVGGSILTECLTRRISGISLLTQASISLPDPGAALTLIRTMNSVYGLDITTEALEENVSQLNEDLSALSDQYRKLQEQRQKKERSEYMYG